MQNGKRNNIKGVHNLKKQNQYIVEFYSKSRYTKGWKEENAFQPLIVWKLYAFAYTIFH